MKILALEKVIPGVDGKVFTESLLREEAERAWELYQAGVIRELYFRADQDSAILLLECADVQEAKATLATLPLVHHCLIDFEIIPLTAYPGFARLFRTE